MEIQGVKSQHIYKNYQLTLVLNVRLITIVIITINYNQLNHEIARMWKMKKVGVIYHSDVSTGDNQKQTRPDKGNVAETMFTWNGQNTAKDATTTPKITGCDPLR